MTTTKHCAFFKSSQTHMQKGQPRGERYERCTELCYMGDVQPLKGHFL